MTLTYLDVASLLFGDRSFTASEFRARTGHPEPAKILSELKRRGHLTREGRGRYRVLGPRERPDLRANGWARARRLIGEAGIPYAWAGPSAVEAWTEGRYTLAPSAVLREFVIAVPKDRAKEWNAYLARHGLEGRRRHIGVRVRLEPRDDLPNVVLLDGEPVIPRSETLRLVREHPALYGSAEELIRDRA